MFWVERSPLTVMASLSCCPLTEAPGSVIDAPAVNAISCSGLRPLRGSSWTWRTVIEVCTVDEVVCVSGIDSVTFTVVSRPPACIVSLRSSCWPVTRAMSARFRVWNPISDIVSSYCPMGRSAKRKMPTALLTVSWLRPVRTFLTVT